ncbi:unnamed protein product, partial [Sphacelaria rigidula]
MSAMNDDEPADHVSMDTRAGITCTARDILGQHHMLKRAEILPILDVAINLHTADGSPLNIYGYLRFTLTLAKTTIVLPNPVHDKLFLDSSIILALKAILDWHK